MSRCPGTTPSGAPCKANVRTGETWCRWHDPTPEGRARHRADSARGGTQKAYGALVSVGAIADAVDVDSLDLTTARGVTALLGATLAQLARLPFDTRTANAIGQCATAARSLIETSDLETRLAALEAPNAKLRRVE